MEKLLTKGKPAGKTLFAKLTERWQDFVIYIVFASIFLLFSFLLSGRGFLQPNNLVNIARQSAMTAIMAVGITFVLSTGEIDLSFGSIIAFSALVTALMLRHTESLVLSVLSGLIAGTLIGAVNGIFVAKIGIPSFLATLGMNGIVIGFARWMTNLQSIPVSHESFTFFFGSGNIGSVPILFFWTFFTALGGHLLLKKTPFGRKTLATGGNKVAAFYSGIPVQKIKFYVMTLNGFMAGLTGLLYAGRLHGARYTLGENDLMVVIASVIIGGTSLFGGKGSIPGAVAGALLMGMLNNGLILMGLSVDQQLISRGSIIILAVTLTMREKNYGIK